MFAKQTASTDPVNRILDLDPISDDIFDPAWEDEVCLRLLCAGSLFETASVRSEILVVRVGERHASVDSPTAHGFRCVPTILELCWNLDASPMGVPVPAAARVALYTDRSL